MGTEISSDDSRLDASRHSTPQSTDCGPWHHSQAVILETSRKPQAGAQRSVSECLCSPSTWRGGDHLSVLDWQRGARFERRAQRTLLVSKTIRYVVADELLRRVVDGLAAMLRRGCDILVLHVLLYLVSCVRPAGGSGYRGHRSPGTASYGAAQQPAGDSTNHRPSDAMGVFHRGLLLDLHVLAFLARCHDRLSDLLDADNIRDLRLRKRVVGRDCPCRKCTHRDPTNHDTFDH